MPEGLSIEAVGLFVGFVLPGLIAQQVYVLIMPTRHRDWKESLGLGITYTLLNYIIWFIPALYVLEPKHIETNPYRYWVSLLVLLIVGPASLPFGWKKLRTSKWIARRIQAPYPTSWDYFFAQRQSVFVRAHLRDGRMVAGLWDGDSYASSYPHEGDLYLSKRRTGSRKFVTRSRWCSDNTPYSVRKRMFLRIKGGFVRVGIRSVGWSSHSAIM
jgi:hypothetical protein